MEQHRGTLVSSFRQRKRQPIDKTAHGYVVSATRKMIHTRSTATYLSIDVICPVPNLQLNQSVKPVPFILNSFELIVSYTIARNDDSPIATPPLGQRLSQYVVLYRGKNLIY